MDIFTEYYKNSFWGNKTGTSGPNSDPALTQKLRDNLQTLLKKYDIHSIVDAGCGDCNLFKSINLAGLEYTGLECVSALTALNKVFFKDATSMHFDTKDVTKDPMPKADLIVSRDVVHYLPNALISKFLMNCKASGSTYLLVTHNTHSALSANSPTELGIFRPVNLSQAPFDLTPLETIEEDVFAKEMALYKIADIE